MSRPFAYLFVLISITIILDYYLVTRWAIYKKLLEKPSNITAKKTALFKQVFLYEPIQNWNNSQLGRFLKKLNLLPYLELLALALWAIYAGWGYLDMDPHTIPLGREFGSSIPANHLWTQILSCGSCAFWNGFQRGGFPAFADIQGSMLHPIVILTTLAFGVVNGVKITIVISFWLAGVAQWWIAHELKVSWLPRMWSAGLAVVGGHLAGRMELGAYGVVLSTTAASLVFAALIRIARNNTRRNAILLGVITASAILSGQGYIQVGLIGILPVFVFFYPGKGNPKSTWVNYGIACTIAFFLAAPFLIPLLHFSVNISKWFDPTFSSAQPISYFILNLVIDDPSYFYSTIMTKFPYPYLYTLYIGWVPVALFIFALNSISIGDRKIISFMIAGIIAEFLIASAIPLKLLVGIWPSIAGVRHPPQIAGLAIPLILGIAAYGLEKLQSLNWEGVLTATNRFFKPIIQILTLALLIYSLNSCLKFTTNWIKVVYLEEDLFLTLEKMKTSELQWVNPPFGEHVYVEPAIAAGLKLSPGIMTWAWDNRIPPSPYITVDRRNPASYKYKLIEDTSEIILKLHEENNYASINSDHNVTACVAIGSGGYIEVLCDAHNTGILTVRENMWSGWRAWMDGEEIKIVEGAQQLQVHAPAGKNKFVFRYQPWDVYLGLLFFSIGVFSSLWLWAASKNDGA